MNQQKQIVLEVPSGESEIVLHACCAPCSLAILECLLKNKIKPTVYFFNPNIFPESEYNHRKNELINYCKNLGVTFIDDDYDRTQWQACTSQFKDEPERGFRCLECFKFRLQKTAEKTKELGLKVFTTSLASSRWKSFEQICLAGKFAEEKVKSTIFWDFNWKKYGLSERRIEILKSGDFYNQLYCGCEYSMKTSQAYQNSCKK